MGAGIRVRLELTWNPARVRARALEAVAALADEYARRAVLLAREQWTGWRYEGRPADAQRGVSGAGWSGRVEVRGRGVELVLLNPVSYVPHVHRAGDDTREWRVVWSRVQAELLPAYARDVARVLARAIEEG